MQRLPKAFCDKTYDAVVIGAGTAGCLTALMLTRSGHDVLVVDRYAHYPGIFQSEQLVGEQIETLRKMGVLPSIVRHDVPYTDRTVAYRNGKRLGVLTVPRYGLPHRTLVTRLREQLSGSVTVLNDRMVATRSDGCRVIAVVCGSGVEVRGRLVVIATGLNPKVANLLGLSVKAIRNFSTTLGFNIVRSVSATRLEDQQGDALELREVRILLGDQRRALIDYVAVFPYENGVRGNVFTFHGHGALWLRDFTAAPMITLNRSINGTPFSDFGLIEFADIHVRSNDITQVTPCASQRNVVLLGDAFLSVCPASGYGLTKMLNDVNALCSDCVPKWHIRRDNNDIDAGAFYSHPGKVACDAQGLHVSHYRRFVTSDMSIRANLERAKNSAVFALRQRGINISRHSAIHI